MPATPYPGARGHGRNGARLAPESQEAPLQPECLVPRLGELLVLEGIITDEELKHALLVQTQGASEGQREFLGKVLVNLGLVSQETLDRVVTQQILQLQAALLNANRLLEKRVEERTTELQHALTRLSELNQLKANFISNVSHELRTPMQFLTGYLELLADHSLGPLTAEQDKAVLSMSGASQRLRMLIEDMLEFAALTSNNLPVRLAATSLDEHLRTAVAQAKPKAEIRQVSIVTELMPETPRVEADGQRISWVIGQLLDNAVKFTPAGGKVAVHTQAHQQNVRVAVADTGIGIPPDRINEIFVPFHQLDGSTKRHYSGTGLGLALAQSILEAHGSSITVSSRVGEGSIFAFSLQIARSYRAS